jgi:hypothetical protein
MKKTFKQFKTISYPNAKGHVVWINGKKVIIPAGRALPDRSPSSAGGNGD